MIGGPVRSCTLLPGFGDPYLATRTDPDWRSAVSPSHMPQAARFQTAPGPCRVHAPRWRKAVGLDPHIREDATRFRNEGARLRTSPSNWQRLSESNAHDP